MKVTFIGSPYYGWDIITLREALSLAGIDTHRVSGLDGYGVLDTLVCYKQGDEAHQPYNYQRDSLRMFPIHCSEFKATIATDNFGLGGSRYCVMT